MSSRRYAAMFGAILCLAAAADPSERISDPVREARARSLFRETRCLVCQGESIDDSDAPLAADLRRAIRERVASGANDRQVRAFLAARYGDFVLFRPRLTWTNAMLWAGPFLAALLGLGLLVGRHHAKIPTETQLTPEEDARLASLEGASDTVAPKLRSKKASRITER
ncbi:MAG TPA: cytochrome c-type biogenesis protein [Caulobacteraceae bacterium]